MNGTPPKNHDSFFTFNASDPNFIDFGSPIPTPQPTPPLSPSPTLAGRVTVWNEGGNAEPVPQGPQTPQPSSPVLSTFGTDESADLMGDRTFYNPFGSQPVPSILGSAPLLEPIDSFIAKCNDGTLTLQNLAFQQSSLRIFLQDIDTIINECNSSGNLSPLLNALEDLKITYQLDAMDI